MHCYDDLTGLYNKSSFFLKVQEMLNTEKTEKYQMISVDVKHFKLINDLFGMQAGDKLLRRIGTALK